MGNQVELIPWAHSIGLEAHAEVINYIKQLPKDSVLCIEATQKDLAFKTEDAEFNALWDVVHECEKRGIKLIPLESPMVRRRYDLNERRATRNKTFKQNKESYLKEIEINSLREKAFAQNIKSTLYTLKKPTLFVLVGARHVNGVLRELTNNKINSRVNVSIFKQKRLMEKIVQFGNRSKSLIRKKINDLNLKLIIKSMKKRDVQKERTALIEKIIQRQYTAKKRIKTKLTRLRR